MTSSSFLHVADVHLDSPLASLKRLDDATASRLHQASRRSLELVAQTAIEREVGAVLIAGDLFDGPIKDASAGLWVEGQFKRLVREGIHVVLIRGNHDANSNARRVSQWPEGVHEFDSGEATSFLMENVGIAAHGQSFGARVESQDLAANYPPPAMGFFNVGLLHTSLAGSTGHDTYAPTSISTLESVGYDYWALGHIHVRTQESLSPKCYIGYSGNTQGRSIRECGAKGCQWVKLQDAVIKNMEFIPTDHFRWHHLVLDVSHLEYLRDLDDLLHQHTVPLVETADGRPLALRVQISGSTTLHGELTRHGTNERLVDTFSQRLGELHDIWLESVKISSTPFLKQSTDEIRLPLKYLSQMSKQCRTDPVLREELASVLEELLKRARRHLSEYGWPLASESERDAEIERYIAMAEDMLVSRMMGEQSA